MSKPVITFMMVLAATAVNAQDTKSRQSRWPAVASAAGTQPFLFDGRMRGDGVGQSALVDDGQANTHMPRLVRRRCRIRMATGMGPAQS